MPKSRLIRMSRTPILAITASAMPSDRAACRAAGMDDFTSNPVRWEKLRSLSLGPLDPQIVAGLHDLRRESSAGEFDAVLANFLNSARLRIENMVEAAGQGDATRLEWIAHSLKGSSGSFGACRMAAMCHELEDLGRAGDLKSAARCLNQLAGEYERVAAALSAEFSVAGSPLPPRETSR